MRRASEVILLAMVILAPWAFGAVEAWAESILYVGIALLTLAGLRGFGAGELKARLLAPPSLALGGLALIACVQALPLGDAISRRVGPVVAGDPSLVPARPEGLRGDDGARVALPAATLSIDPDSSIQMAARLGAAWLLFLVVSAPGWTEGARSRLSGALIVNAVALGLFAIVQSLTWNGCIYWVRPSPSTNPWASGGPFVSHNHLAAYLNIGFGFAAASLLSRNPREWLRRDSGMFWTAYAAAMISAAIVTSQSRSGFVGLAAICLVLGLRSWRDPRAFLVVLGLIAVTAGLYLTMLAPSSSFTSRLATILDPGDNGYQYRFEAWGAAIRAWWSRPVLGSGLGSFAIAVVPYLRRSHPIFFARAENEYLDLLAEAGAVGLLLALVFLGSIGRLGYLAIRDVSRHSERDRTFVWGCLLGLLALSVQSLADFAPHVPAIGVVALVLCAHVASVARDRGLAARPAAKLASGMTLGDWLDDSRTPRERKSSRQVLPGVDAATIKPDSSSRPRFRVGAVPLLAWLGCVALAFLLVAHGGRDALVEYRLQEVGLPSPGAYLPSIAMSNGLSWELEASRDALRAALRLRPNWAEGHARLGLVHLSLYNLMAREWLERSNVEPEDVDRMADPTWIHGVVRSASTRQPGDDAPEEDVRDSEPVLTHLVPAARSFLEARRCSPRWVLPQAEIASLAYLLEGGDSASAYGDRASRLAGGDTGILLFVARVAQEVGDRALAARCWRGAIEGSPWRALEIADAAAEFLTPEEILARVVPDARAAIEFAGRLYSEPDRAEIRDKYLTFALENLEADPGLEPAERLFLQGEALAGLGRADQACQKIEGALTLQPGRSPWRARYVDWLLRWGRQDEAHTQALLGIGLAPSSPELRLAIDRTAEALARGKPEG